MYRFGLEFSIERQSEISSEELEDDGTNEEFFNPEDNWDDEPYEDEDDEPMEREYCD